MAENVYRKRSGSLTLKQSRGKTKSEENVAGDDTTKGTIKDDVVRKVIGGKSKEGMFMAKRSQSKGEHQIISEDVLADTDAKKSGDGAKITGEEGSTKAKSVLDNEENFSTPLKRKRGADAEIVLAYYSSQEISPRLRPRQAPTFRMIELGENDDKRIIDKRVKVYWPESRKWFAGQIKAFDDNKRLHTVLYDDGDKEELDLSKERFELEILPTEGFNLRAESISKKKVKRLDGNEVSAPVLPETTSQVSDAKEVKSSETNANAKEVKIPKISVDATKVKSPELKTKDASKKMGRRVLSKLQRKSTRINQDSAANMGQMNAGKEMDMQYDDEVKKSKLDGDVSVKEVVEVNPQTDTDKVEAAEKVDDKNGGSSYKAQGTIVYVPAEKDKVDGNMEKQKKTENIRVSEDALTRPGMKGNKEDQPPNMEDTNPGEQQFEEGVISIEITAPLPSHADSVKYHNDRKSVLKEAAEAASEVSVDQQQPPVESSPVITSESAGPSANKLHLPKNQEKAHSGMLQESQKVEKVESADNSSKKEIE